MFWGGYEDSYVCDGFALLMLIQGYVSVMLKKNKWLLKR